MRSKYAKESGLSGRASKTEPGSSKDRKIMMDYQSEIVPACLSIEDRKAILAKIKAKKDEMKMVVRYLEEMIGTLDD
jgi:hypothetical protein